MGRNGVLLWRTCPIGNCAYDMGLICAFWAIGFRCTGGYTLLGVEPKKLSF
jgi:hypothetical protein